MLIQVYSERKDIAVCTHAMSHWRGGDVKFSDPHFQRHVKKRKINRLGEFLLYLMNLNLL